ncbi:MAG: cupin-like domain-containing protein [Flavobacteriales bacterium]|nr:cupin-like domain-containing protein [Flavobacteriales bacterium]MBP6641579.1 cupin-like domain-containing protein [Flavobacteriales bacterium]MBP7155220.1 cupin-like domain-containing protein [Flavobacteriales bacterium]HQV74372.1 cupin-like domain-containing protein [Flavobacteriales bacterium]HQW40435.1 cupin-like domain-containing protein [Flavobacteriales bacterium]
MANTSPLLRDGLPGVERRSGLSTKEFMRDYVAARKPVILTDFTKNWAAKGKWTPEFFAANYGHLTHEVKGKKYSVAEQMELIKTSTEEKPAPYSYNLNIDHVFPELKADVEPMLMGRQDRLVHPLVPKALLRGTVKHEIFFGGKGASFPVLHVDLQHLHTQITQLYGDKEFFLFAPDQTPNMYPRPSFPLYSDVDNVFDPDLKKFPLFGEAKGYREYLREGETIFFPTGWWHMTRIPGPSISYGRALLEGTNWNDYLNDTYDGWKKKSSVMAIPAYALGKAAGMLMDLDDAVRS